MARFACEPSACSSHLYHIICTTVVQVAANRQRIGRAGREDPSGPLRLTSHAKEYRQSSQRDGSGKCRRMLRELYQLDRDSSADHGGSPLEA